MSKAAIITGLVSTIALGFAVAAHAQSFGNPVVLPQVELEVKRMELIPSAPLQDAIITQVHSGNESVARAYPYRNAQVQVVAVAPGRADVEFWDSESRTAYRVPVWVVNSGAVASHGYDQTKRQLSQIVMQPRHSR